MKHRRVLRSGAVLVVALALGASIFGQSVALRYRWTKGEALKYLIAQETALTMTGLPGMGDMAVTSKGTMSITMTPEDIAADGTATLKDRFDGMRLDVTTPMGSISIDSATPPTATPDPATAGALKVLHALVGETVTVVMAPTGAIKSVDGMTKISAKLKATISDASDPTTTALQQALDVMMTDESFKGSVGQIFATLPDKAAAPGDTWQSELTAAGAIGSTTSSSVFTMKGIDRVEGRELSRIAISQTVKVAPGGMLGPMAVTAKDGKGDGELLFDHQRGRLVNGVVHVMLPLTLAMTAPDGTAITMQGESRSTIRTGLVDR